jgi:predicted dehydrogenase
MKVLMIGTGSIGRRHMASLRQLVPDVRFDVLREGRDADTSALGDFEVEVSASLEQALAKRPQLMVIANPSALHARFILAALDHGIPFYAEKPVLHDATDLARVRDKLHTVACPPNIVGCNLRFLPSLQRLRGLVQDGSLGRIVRAGFEAGQWLPDWRPSQDYRRSYSARRELGGGVLLDLIHETDAARWMLGEFSRVSGQVGHLSDLEIETEDCACFVLGSDAGPLVTVQLDYVSRRPFRRYRIVGDRATAEWDLPARTLTLSDAQGLRTLETTAADFDVAATYPAAMRELLDAVAAARPSSQPLEEGLRSLELVLRLRLNSASASP